MKYGRDLHAIFKFARLDNRDLKRKAWRGCHPLALQGSDLSCKCSKITPSTHDRQRACVEGGTAAGVGRSKRNGGLVENHSGIE